MEHSKAKEVRLHRLPTQPAAEEARGRWQEGKEEARQERLSRKGIALIANRADHKRAAHERGLVRDDSQADKQRPPQQAAERAQRHPHSRLQQESDSLSGGTEGSLQLPVRTLKDIRESTA